MTPIQQQKAARDFAAHWAGKGYEKGESQIFWIELLAQVFGVQTPSEYLHFEQQVKLDHTSFIDAYIPRTHVMIEQKSIEKNLGDGIKQSDGSVLNPFQQAKRYAAELPYSQRPRWIVTSNFAEFWVYDMEQPNGEPQRILLKDLEKEYYRLQFLVDEGNEHLKREMEVSVKAGELVGIIYDKLLEQYIDKDSPETLRSLNILCVRLVFCMYAEDAGLFATHTAFHDYLKKYGATDFRRALMDLFVLLDTPLNERDPYLQDDIAAFPYVNGGLFSDEKIIVPRFPEQLQQLLLEKASADFDWSEISPTIFGAVFESTLNPETRRSGGMHYTSIENIHKVIDPLFMNDLQAEFTAILSSSPASPLSSSPASLISAKKRQALAAFQDKLASLTFLDPACGSGNFLTETFLSLRRLENEVIKAMYGDMRQFDFGGTIKVNISQFYGIEINDFACTVAKTALWIAESQTLKETSAIIGVELNFLPLKTNAYIHEGNALRIDWADIVAPDKLSYIMGNPPFVGARFMSTEQKDDLLAVFGEKWKNVGNLDFVCAWYKKAMDLMTDTDIHAAFVSTNSICQGESVANLWGPLMKDGLQMDFAHRTFRWDSEAKLKAHVHCIIIGFSFNKSSLLYTLSHMAEQSPALQAMTKIQDTLDKITKPYQTLQQITEPARKLQRILFDESGIAKFPENINAYLIDGPDVFIESRNKPICNVPEMGVGSQAIDDGHFIFTQEQKDEFIAKEPKSAQYFHRWFGADEFINNKVRYCLYLGNCSPAELRAMPLCMERVAAVREFRLASKRTQTLKAADWPNKFAMTVIPDSNYLLIPRVSSERRRYVPIGFMSPDEYVNDAVQIIPSATLYHFGVLTSNVHMAWMRAVCGRLEMRYRYSKDIVYNNFPWPGTSAGSALGGIPSSSSSSSSSSSAARGVSTETVARIEQTAQAILDARALYPDSSLADLYDETTMPLELRRAHQANDRAVMQAYGLTPGKTTESDCVAHLFSLYQSLTQ